MYLAIKATTMTKTKKSDFILVTALTILMVMGTSKIIASIGTINPVQAQPVENGSFKVIVNVKGIDPTVAKAQIWVTGKAETESTTLNNPISLTNANNNDEGSILKVEFEFKQGIIKEGDQIEACIKVLEDKDKEGTHFACQKEKVNTSANEPQTISIVL
jgi:hypothetical protein